MDELTRKRRLARLLLGIVLMSLGSFVVWKSHEVGLGVFGSRLLAGVAAMVAAYGLMSVLGSGVLAALMALGGSGFFFWSLWAVLSGRGDADVAKLGLWCGPLVGIVGFVYASPHWQSKTTEKRRS